MKIKQVRETSTDELLAQVKTARRQILEARVNKVRTLRRDVARMLTVVRERELQEKSSK